VYPLRRPRKIVVRGASTFYCREKVEIKVFED
jgi:hypothetical protein